MTTVEKKRNVSKYSNLSEEEKQQKHKEAIHDWYARKTPEEKQELFKKVALCRQGICEICKTNRVYVDLPKHKKSQAHIRNMENQKS
jgi:hypothetical protein